VWGAIVPALKAMTAFSARSGSSRCPGQTASVRPSQCMTSRHATPRRQEKILLDTTGRE